MKTCQLVSYIAPAAPAARRQAQGDEPFLRPEIGFTPNWYRTALGIDFSQQWHTDPAYRRETILAMRGHLCWDNLSDDAFVTETPYKLVTYLGGFSGFNVDLYFVTMPLDINYLTWYITMPANAVILPWSD